MSIESADPSLFLIRKFNKEKVPLPPFDTKSLINFIQASAHLSVEIGCGAGLHPLQWSKSHPSRQLLAIEKTKEKFRKFQARYIESGSPANLFPLHAHAVSIITHLIDTHCVEEFFILFPNPEIKNPQARWIRMPFFSEILRCLKKGGMIHFATNEDFYAKEIEEFAAQTWNLRILEKKLVNDPKAATTARTHFEKKYLERGQTIHSISLTNSLS